MEYYLAIKASELSNHEEKKIMNLKYRLLIGRS